MSKTLPTNSADEKNKELVAHTPSGSENKSPSRDGFVSEPDVTRIGFPAIPRTSSPAIPSGNGRYS